jgi:hypothetical protein
MISAKIVADSINRSGNRLSTFQVRIPKWLLAELNTHRQLSRNYSSSRAVPAKTCRKLSDYSPINWGKNQSGMQGAEELEGFNLLLAKFGWEMGRVGAKLSHRILEASGLHKQYTNRVLEPYTWADGVLSGTEWENFLMLRCDADAQPDIMVLANQIRELLKSNKPKMVEDGEWHLPFIDLNNQAELKELVHKNYSPLLISAARVARVSYGYGNSFDLDKDYKRGNMLLDARIPHISPFEMVAIAGSGGSGNYQGWRQLRKDLEEQPVLTKHLLKQTKIG